LLHASESATIGSRRTYDHMADESMRSCIQIGKRVS
jgi:hypothetical protein